MEALILGLLRKKRGTQIVMSEAQRRVRRNDEG
jgi:hypothetical protein